MDELPIGRYGTIHYMSNNGSEVPLASYPVDEDVINLGRSDHNTCHIRLIDPRCSDIHCKLIFEDGKVRSNFLPCRMRLKFVYARRHFLSFSVKLVS